MAKPPIRTRPHWSLPSKSRIDAAIPTRRMVEAFIRCHTGLEEIRIHIHAMHTPDGAVGGGEIQRLALNTRKGEVPEIEAEDLAKIVWLRGEVYVRKHKAKTQFRVQLIGTEDDTAFDEQCRFQILPKQVLADDLGEEGEEEEEEDDDEEEEEGEDDEDEEEDDDEDDDEDQDDEDDGPKPLVPLEERLEPGGGRHLVPQTINPAFISHLQRGMLTLAHKAYAGPMRENRILVHEMRREMSATIRDVKADHKMVLEMLMRMQEQQQLRHDSHVRYLSERLVSVETMLIDNTKLNARQYENLQELAQQGWKAFLDSMRMKSEVLDDRIETMRWLEEEKDRLPQRQAPPVVVEAKKEGSAADLVRQATESPLVISGFAILLRKMGNEQGAQQLEKIAENLSKRVASDDDDDDDEDEDEEQQAEAPREKGNGHAHANRSTSTAFADRCRAFFRSITPDVLDKVKDVLPRPAWRALQSASRATTDDVAMAGIRAVSKFIGKDPLLLLKLGELLSEDQIGQIMELVGVVERAPSPPAE